MADRLKDSDDARLEALFRSGPIDDDGFSKRIEKRIRRDILIRRWTLPIAVLTGGLIAAQPAAQLLLAFADIVSAMPADIRALPVDSMPQLATFVLAGTVVGFIALFLKGLEE